MNRDLGFKNCTAAPVGGLGPSTNGRLGSWDRDCGGLRAVGGVAVSVALDVVPRVVLGAMVVVATTKLEVGSSAGV